MIQVEAAPGRDYVPGHFFRGQGPLLRIPTPAALASSLDAVQRNPGDVTPFYPGFHFVSSRLLAQLNGNIFRETSLCTSVAAPAHPCAHGIRTSMLVMLSRHKAIHGQKNGAIRPRSNYTAL